MLRTTACPPPSHWSICAVVMPAAMDTTSGRCAWASDASDSQTPRITCGFTASSQVPAPSAAFSMRRLSSQAMKGIHEQPASMMPKRNLGYFTGN